MTPLQTSPVGSMTIYIFAAHFEGGRGVAKFPGPENERLSSSKIILTSLSVCVIICKT